MRHSATKVLCLNRVGCAAQAVLEAGGCTGATVDEYFFQDKWRGPTSVKDQILLFLGDPLMTVRF